VTKSDAGVEQPRPRFGVHEAKTQLSQLLRRASAGESIDIERRGVVVARLVPPASRSHREFGTEAGRFEVPDDFDAPLSDEQMEAFGG